MAVLTAIPLIPLAVGSSRVVKGMRVEHVCGNPLLSREDDLDLQIQIVETGLKALQTSVKAPTLFEMGETRPRAEVARA